MPAGNLFISAITVLELEMGTLQIERRDAMQCSARLHLPGRRPSPMPRCLDALIAVTALVHGMTVVTRHVVDFALLEGVTLLNSGEVTCETESKRKDAVPIAKSPARARRPNK